MNKNIIIGLVVLVLAIGGWYIVTSMDNEKMEGNPMEVVMSGVTPMEFWEVTSFFEGSTSKTGEAEIQEWNQVVADLKMQEEKAVRILDTVFASGNGDMGVAFIEANAIFNDIRNVVSRYVVQEKMEDFNTYWMIKMREMESKYILK